MRSCRIPLVVLWLAAFSLGCGQTVSTIDPPGEQPFHAQRLRVECSPTINVTLVRQFAAEWSRQQGAVVDVETNASESFHGDIAITTAAELPALAETGRFRQVPSPLLARDHAFQWDGFVPLYAGLLTRWDDKTYGVPLVGEGLVLVYRKDRLREAKLEVPLTWEEFVECAKRLGPGSLPALPLSARALDAEFHTIAACYDRAAVLQDEKNESVTDEASVDRAFSYQYFQVSNEPRINAASFIHAFEIMHALQPLRSDSVDAFLDGKASLAVATLADVARYQGSSSGVRGLFGIAPLPGAKFNFDFETGKRQPTRGDFVSHVPYLGTASWVGLVSKDCANPDLAFAFLIAFGHPEKFGAETIAATRWGAGPLRTQHTEDRGRGLWYGYDLPAPETEHLLAALKQNLAAGAVNHRHCLRLPNERKHIDEFDRIVRPALMREKATGKQTLDELAAAWRKLWDSIPADKKQAWIRQAEGI